MRTRHVVLPLLLSVGAAACGSDGSFSGSGSGTSQAVAELEESGIAEFLGAQAPVRSQQSGAWTDEFFDASEQLAICLTGGDFQVSHREGTSGDLLLYLQGGGACWDYVTCHVANTATKTANGAIEAGILDPARPGNPFADFDVTYVPYCDGSVFSGTATVDYDGVETNHHGLQNLSAAVTAMRARFPNPSRIVVAGSSAGGYGTFAGYGVARVAYPDTPIIVFNDSGPGVQNFDASEDVQNRVANWDFAERVPESCNECDTQYSYLADWALDRDATARFAFYSYQQDGVISFFLDLSGPAYQQLVLSVTDDLLARNPGRFARYFPLGTTHTVLLSSEFYTQVVNGVPLRDWTQAFLDDSSGWVDVVE
jgi:hypothetical protein